MDLVEVSSWPLSTDSLPKPFLPLFGEKNLLEKTLYRLSFFTIASNFDCNQPKIIILSIKKAKNK